MGNSNQSSKKATSSNRLVGWLVSFAKDANGAAYEIRAGRSLLSGSKQADQRIIYVDEPSVSGPHAALSASTRHRLMVQDIFSQSGTYLTRSNSDKELPVSGPIEIEHGDWLRVGETARFQVCLIDGPRR
jgi:hypothetical protein